LTSRLVHYSAFVIRAILYFVLVVLSAPVFYGIIWASIKMMRNIPFGLMTLAYLYAKSEDAERVFLDVFSDEKKYINMYKKLGFQTIGKYE